MRNTFTITILCLFWGLNTFAARSQQVEVYPLARQDSVELNKHLSLSAEEEAKGKWKNASDHLNKVAYIYWEHNYLQEALDYYFKSISLNKSLSNDNGIAMINSNVAMIYADLKQYENSLEYFRKTLAARRFKKEKVGIISAIINMSVVLNNLGKYQESADLLEEAKVLALELNDPEQQRLCYGSLAETYQKLGNTKKMLEYFELYRSWHQLVTENQIEQTREEARAAKLKQQIAELDRQKQELEIQAQQKELNEKSELIKEYDSITLAQLENLSDLDLQIHYLESQKEKTYLLELQNQQKAEIIKKQGIVSLALIGLLLLSLLLVFVFFKGRKKERKAKDILLSKNERINQQNEEITAQAEQLQLQNSKLRELDRFKQGMTTMLVHDLKTPLSNILNIPDDEPNTTQLVKVKQSARQLLNLVLNILDVQKHTNAKVVLNKENAHITVLAASALNQVEHLVKERHLRVESNIPSTFMVNVDAELIERVLVNLLTNAIKFSPLNTTISLNCRKQDGYINFSVSDNGEGVPSDKLSTVFDEFSQVMARKSGSARSTGIGLAFCKLAIESHSGSIGVESEVGNYTMFWFRLPLAGEEESLVKQPSIEKEEGEAIAFTNVELEMLKPFVEELGAKEIYEVSEIRAILKNIIEDSDTVLQWKEDLYACVRVGNEERYMQLLHNAGGE